MAYVVARRNGRFEIRESLYTSSGPRARTLAGFSVLTDEVLANASRRATRPFDADAVIASGRRAGAPARAAVATRGSAGSVGQFIEATRRMATALQPTGASERIDPGEALIDLLGFADAVTASQPSKPPERLSFPPLSRLLERRPPATDAR